MPTTTTRRQSLSPDAAAADIKQRVNRCMIKLSDRDTESMAVAELELIARSLTADSLPSFITAVSDARPSDKTPLRRHSLRLLSLLSRSHPSSLLHPLLPRLLSAALRRLRDPDSSVRSALVDAVSSFAQSAPDAVSSALFRPLVDALLHEQDACAQAASALCLAAAVDATHAATTADPELTHQLRNLVPKLIKLAKSNAFKAKPALILLMGSVASAGGASTQNLIGMLVPCLVEFLASEDWNSRKASAEALARVGVADRDLLGEIKASCLTSFESRRFDKVKIVRDSMNRMVEVWKDIPIASLDDGDGDGDDSVSKPQTNLNGRGSTSSVQSNSPFFARKNRVAVSRSPPPIATTRKKSSPNIERKLLQPLSSRKPNNDKNSDWKVDIADSQATHFPGGSEDKFSRNKENNTRSKFEAKRMMFDNNHDDKATKLGGGLKSGSRVVPFEVSGNSEVITAAHDSTIEVHGDGKDGDLNLIRRQLMQIESQQSSLLELLQKFIGSSQKGIHSLETRVHGLEMVLDEISHDLAVTSGRLSSSDPAATTCCSLPGAEFLSPKFWRRADGGRLSLSGNPAMAGVRYLAEKHGGENNKQRPGLQKSFIVNPLARDG